MKKFLTNAYIKGATAMLSAKAKCNRLVKEEKGGSEIIATIILVAVVVLLALFFREQIGSLISNIWNSITGAEGEITESFG